ncbi:MAG TPA: hypothetical protein VHZ50_13565 [Puia sp.]|jgi:hypothetical protein|nr:hypothetical protein [Puia sp.]
MTKKVLYTFAGIITMLIFFLIACTKQNEQALINQSGVLPCDTTNMSYANDITPILENNCVSCHNTTQSNDGVILTDYNDVLTQVNNGNLVNVIEHNPGYPEMPQGLPQLPSCTINKIVAWVNRGAPNN